MTAQKLSSYLAGPSLRSLSPQAECLLELQQVYTAIAPAELIESSRVGNLKAGVLVIVADNGAVAAKLRQLTPRLLSFFGQRGNEVTAIRVQVQASPPREDKLMTKQAKMSTAAIQHLARFSSALADSPLKSALARMLARQRRG
ncbi:MAG TPA: DciA family protein [Burkholderiales bacterium]|nr:DciA family protein [Burkholderiales bacterium]